MLRPELSEISNQMDPMDSIVCQYNQREICFQLSSQQAAQFFFEDVVEQSRNMNYQFSDTNQINNSAIIFTDKKDIIYAINYFLSNVALQLGPQNLYTEQAIRLMEYRDKLINEVGENLGIPLLGKVAERFVLGAEIPQDAYPEKKILVYYKLVENPDQFGNRLRPYVVKPNRVSYFLRKIAVFEESIKECQQKIVEVHQKIEVYRKKISQNLSNTSKLTKLQNQISLEEKTIAINKSDIRKYQFYIKLYRSSSIKEKKLNMVEVANSLLVESQLPNNVPKARLLYTLGGLLFGLTSEYAMLTTFFKLNNCAVPPTAQQFLDWGVVKALVAGGYCIKNLDMHDRNFAVGKKRIGVKDTALAYDFGLSSTPIVARFYFDKPQILEMNPTPADMFKFSSSDVDEFPRLVTSQPLNSLYNNQAYTDQRLKCPDLRFSHSLNVLKKIFDELIGTKEFDEQKYYAFLKRILFYDNYMQNIANAAITFVNLRKEWSEEHSNLTQELLNILLSMQKFREYLFTHSNIIDTICSEFEEHNKHYKNNKYNTLWIDLEEVRNKFKQLINDAFAYGSSSIEEERERQSNESLPQASSFLDFPSLNASPSSEYCSASSSPEKRSSSLSPSRSISPMRAHSFYSPAKDEEEQEIVIDMRDIEKRLGI